MDLNAWLLRPGREDEPGLVDAAGMLTRGELDVQATERMRHWADENHGADVVLSGHPDRDFVVDYLAALRSGRTVVIDAAGGRPGPATTRLLDHAGDRPAIVMFTSGTSAVPVPVSLTSKNLIANGSAIVETLGIRATDRVLCALPFAYSFGLSLLNTALAAGACVVLPGRLLSAPELVANVRRYEASILGTVPTIARRLVRRANALCACDSLRMVQIAGGRLDAESTRALVDVFDGRISLQIMYGLTEATARVTAFDACRNRAKIGSCGRPVIDVTVHCEEPIGRVVAAGSSGTVVVGGPGVCAPLARPDGFLVTSDYGFVDQDGFLWITGRVGDFVKVGDVRVSIGEIEDFLRQQPGVDEAVAVPVADPVLTERVVVLVTVDEPLADVQKLLATARAQLPREQIPSSVHRVDRLPMRPSGKVDRLAAAAIADALEERRLDGYRQEGKHG